MQIERPLFWHQGLFLQPQHLQLDNLHQQALVRPFQKYVQPHFWGVADLQIQESALNNKSFEVINGEFVFPDGSYTAFPGNAMIKARSFDDSWLEGEKPFTVYLGLRQWNRTGNNVTVVPNLDEPTDLTTRFVTTADPEEVIDLHGGGPAAQVKRLNYVLRVFWETEIEQLDYYHLMPIAQIERDGEEIRLSRRFIPPCLTIAASDWLIKVMKDVRDQVTSRCRQIEEYKSPKGMQIMDFDISYVVFLLALRSLNRYVPLLHHVSEIDNIHPWQVYALMRQLIGELSTFSEDLSATGERDDGSRALPTYDHTNLWYCFSSVQRLVGELLDGITVGPGHRIRLEYDGKYYSGQMSEAMLSPRNTFWLVLRTQADPDEVTQAVHHVAKLCTYKNISTLIARAIPGVPLEYFPTPPPGLPRRANSFYYRIDHTSPLWMSKEAPGAISLFWDFAPEDLVAEILILRG